MLWATEGQYNRDTYPQTMREPCSLHLIQDVQAKEGTRRKIPVLLDVKRPPPLLKAAASQGLQELPSSRARRS